MKKSSVRDSMYNMLCFKIVLYMLTDMYILYIVGVSGSKY